MWTSKNIHIENFTKFARVYHGMDVIKDYPCSRLLIENVEIINFIDSIQTAYSDSFTYQFIICEECLHYNCSGGNFVSLRENNGFYFFIPAFAKMSNSDYRDEYFPPFWLNQKGILYLSKIQYEMLCFKVPFFKELGKFKPLSKHELLFLLRWKHSKQEFSVFPNFKPFVDSDIEISSYHDDSLVIPIINTLLLKLENSPKFTLEKLKPEDETISLFLTENFTEIVVLRQVGEEFQLVLDETFAVVLE